MSWFHESQDRLPLTWWKGRPVYLAAILAMGGLASMILTAFLMAAGGIAENLVFTYDNAFHRMFLWTPLTYVLINPPSLWLFLTSAMLWWFGEDVEKYLGRRIFVRLLLALVLATPLVFTLVSFFGELLTGHPLETRNWAALGFGGVEFGVFLAFVTLYPRARISLIIVTIEAWIIAAAIVGVDLLQYIAARNLAGIVLLTTQVAVAFGYVRYEQGAWHMPEVFSLKWLRRPAPAPNLKIVPKQPKAAAGGSSSSPLVSEEQVDAILDKINREGMQSLTPEERRALEKASDSLSRRKDR